MMSMPVFQLNLSNYKKVAGKIRPKGKGSSSEKVVDIMLSKKQKQQQQEALDASEREKLVLEEEKQRMHECIFLQ